MGWLTSVMMSWVLGWMAQAAPGAAACDALRQVALPGVQLTSAVYQDASSGPAPGSGMPSHCLVRGAIDPRTGTDGKHYETRFELRLPTAWSGRFLYQGGGGNDGTVGSAVGRNTGSFPDTGLSRGFAVVSTDAGHQGTTPEFGLDRTARTDHAYAAHDRTARVARALVAQYYGRAAAHSYFVGCSGGGRQGMMFAQRFPEYFDGIVACAPAMSVSSGATIAAAWDTIAYGSIAPRDDAGKPILSAALSPSDLELVSRAVLDRCDAADGATDGMVQRVGACRFDPGSLRCAAAKTPSCLSAWQVDVLRRTFGGPQNSQGRRLYVGQPWDPGISTPGWRQWKLGTSPTGTPNAMNTTLMAGALGYEFLTPASPDFSIFDFDFDRDPPRMEVFSREYDTYRDAMLNAFKNRGGKLLLFHGAADPIFSALESIDYYQRLVENNGGLTAAQAWARLFLVPGMNHCAGGAATDSFDGLQAIVDWVEQGVAPGRIAASALPTNPYFANRERPLCAYPAYAKYTGTGSIERASSFVCATE